MSDTGSAAPAASNTAPVDSGASTEVELSPDEAATEAQETAKAEAKSLKKKYQLKVNNKTKDFELDLGNDEEVQKYLQKAMASDEKFQEASMLRKQVEQLVKELKENPLAILKHPELGIDVKALAQRVMNEELEEMQLSPEQKRIRELEVALKEKEEREKKATEEKTALERAKFEAEAAQNLDSEISAALAKSTLPKSPYVVKRIADSMIAAMEMGFKEVTVDQVLPFVEDQILGEINRLFEEAPEDTFDRVMEGVIGKKHLDKYRKTKVSKSKPKASTTTAKQIKDTGSSAKPKEEPKKEAPKRFKDMFGTF